MLVSSSLDLKNYSLKSFYSPENESDPLNSLYLIPAKAAVARSI